MRAWLALALLAGCLAAPGESSPELPLDIYVFEDPGSDMFNAPHGVMVRITNPTPEPVRYEVRAPNMTAGLLGPVYPDGWSTGTGIRSDGLDPGESRLWLFEFAQTFVMHVYEIEVAAGGATFAWEQTLKTAGGVAIEPGMHVQTYTVGVWANGTSFYTNNAALNDDPAFPAGYDRAAFSGDALPVYVYDQDRSEQPDRSIDTCQFTTVPGYNELLKAQTEGGTGVRYLEPEEGYTRPGNEDHFLYGEPLIFMNRVAAIEDRDERLDDVPDPEGACFDPDRYTPDPIPDLPPLR